MRFRMIVYIGMMMLVQTTIAQIAVKGSIGALDSVTQAKIEKWENDFEEDSISIIDDAKEKIQKKREALDRRKQELTDRVKKIEEKSSEKKVADIETDMEKKKVEQAEAIPVAKPMEEERNKIRFSSLADRKQLLGKLMPAKEFPNVKLFIDSLVVADSNVVNYIRILPVLKKINTELCTLPAYNDSILRCFIEGVEGVKMADEVLRQSFNKRKRDAARLHLKSQKFQNEGQQHQAERLLEAVQLYYLATSNMIDLIGEIKKSYATYCSAATTEAQRIEAQTQLKESMEIDARLENFKLIPYMWNMYDRINNEVLKQDAGSPYTFDRINMKLLDEIKEELEKSRAIK